MITDGEWQTVIQKFPEANRPDVSFVRFVEADEVSTVRASCMNDLGFVDATSTPDGGIDSGAIPDGQAEAYAIGMYTCGAMYPLDPKYDVPLTDDRISELFDYYLEELKPCLENEGFELPEPPTRQAFIENYPVDGGWDLYGTVAQAVDGQDAWYAINQKCPQLPNGFVEQG